MHTAEPTARRAFVAPPAAPPVAAFARELLTALPIVILLLAMLSGRLPGNAGRLVDRWSRKAPGLH